ncbi:glycosyltransferase family 4 protein [Pelistega ratti]|uniref:glycosyltransferase family 4 protein n=1 Tax=Pelistega ratti TaxID=2652177 RepID=UPI001359729E|nr:glycosyltransferase family 4 protein [Pelistega ratti]
MQISLVCNKFQNGGGIERYTIDLVNGFYTYNKKNHKINVYATNFDQTIKEYGLITPKKINLSFIPKKLRHFFLSYQTNKQKTLNDKLISLIFTKADIIICGGNHLGYINALGKRPSYLSRLKIHNEKSCFNQADLIIAHSKLMKDEISKFYHIDQNKIEIIYPPVDTNKFLITTEQNREYIRAKYGFKSNEIIYLFPSTGHTRKGFSILRNYFSQTTLPIRLVVVGTPVTEEPHISSLGYCTNMVELYQMADYTIMASLYEPFGLVGIESILCGTPIVFANNIGCLEVLQHQFGFTFNRDEKTHLNQVIHQSVEYALQKKYRITNPLSCLKYNPSIEQHIQDLIHRIERYCG